MSEERDVVEQQIMDSIPSYSKGETAPYNDLDMQFKTTNPAWGREATAYLDKKLTRAKEGKEEEKNWELLAYYTRDLRLANIDTGEMIYCGTWLDIAGDCLRQGYTKSFVTALSRVVTVLELSQSKRGFLRRRHGTYTRETVSREENAPKNILTGKRQEV